MKVTIDLRILILCIGILLIIGGVSVMAQNVSLETYTYTPNATTSVHQYADTNAPAVAAISAGVPVTLYQPFQLNDMLWWASLSPNNDQWIAFASIGQCERIPFGKLSN